MNWWFLELVSLRHDYVNFFRSDGYSRAWQFFCKKVLITLWSWCSSFQSDHHNIFLATKVSLALKIFQNLFPKWTRKTVLPILTYFINLTTLQGKEPISWIYCKCIHISSWKGCTKSVTPSLYVWRHWFIWIFFPYLLYVLAITCNLNVK